MKVDKKYLYTDDETGNLVYDFCWSCDNPCLQEDDGEGVFRCEHCKNYNRIEIKEA